jgi:hypothetical protein
MPLSGRLMPPPPDFDLLAVMPRPRRRLPIITSAEEIQGKKDMVSALSDIEQALTMQKQQAAGAAPEEHPLDRSYRSLAADLEALE